MTEYSIQLPLGAVQDLVASFRNGPLIEHQGKEVHFLTEEKFDEFEGVKVDVFSNEHPPPHFRVTYQGSNANFTIKDCKMLNGSGQVVRYERNIRKWWKSNKVELIKFWDEKRPSDCPVGKYRE